MNVAPRTRALDGKLYGKAGEVTYCANGHPLGKFTRDVHMGKSAAPEDFHELMPGALGSESCPQCGADVTAGDGIYFFEKR